MIGIILNKPSKNEDNNNFKIINSFYPIYVLSLNITDGAQNVENTNMAEKATGCIHDYTLTTEDLKKLENANVFIENGGDLEPFSDKIKELYPNVQVIDVSKNVTNILGDAEETNSHFWLSLKNYKTEINVVYEDLVIANPENKDVFETNKNDYISKIEELETTINEKKESKGHFASASLLPLRLGVGLFFRPLVALGLMVDGRCHAYRLRTFVHRC